MTKSAIQMKRRCRTCRGEGIVEDYHCRLCLQRIADADAWWFSDDEALPCGHAEEHLVEVKACPECVGAGQVEQWLTPAEVMAIRRGKIARVIFIVGTFIAFAIVLASVIWSSSAVEPVCGYWWYVIPPLLFTANHLQV